MLQKTMYVVLAIAAIVFSFSYAIVAVGKYSHNRDVADQVRACDASDDICINKAYKQFINN